MPSPEDIQFGGHTRFVRAGRGRLWGRYLGGARHGFNAAQLALALRQRAFISPFGLLPLGGSVRFFRPPSRLAVQAHYTGRFSYRPIYVEARLILERRGGRGAKRYEGGRVSILPLSLGRNRWGGPKPLVDQAIFRFRGGYGGTRIEGGGPAGERGGHRFRQVAIHGRTILPRLFPYRSRLQPIPRPAGAAWPFPYKYRRLEARLDARIVTGGGRFRPIPRPPGGEWPFPHRWRQIQSRAHPSQLAGRVRLFVIPHPLGAPWTFPWTPRRVVFRIDPRREFRLWIPRYMRVNINRPAPPIVFKLGVITIWQISAATISGSSSGREWEVPETGGNTWRIMSG